MARQGKIARLPNHLRREVNQRLLDGQTAPVILAWLNDQPEAVKIWEAHFEGVPANAQNLSEWRLGGYKDWIADNEKAEALKTLTDFSISMAKANGGNIAKGAEAAIAGHILGNLEALIHADEGSEEPDDPIGRLQKLTDAVAKIRRNDQREEKDKNDKKRLRILDRQQALNQKKFETQTVNMFIEWARTPEAVAILESGKPKHVQMDLIRGLLFGKPPEEKEVA